MKRLNRLTATAALCTAALNINAATLVLIDGSHIEGDLVKIHEGVVHFETGFAGVLEIPQAQVSSLLSETALALRTSSGEVFQGPVQSGDGGSLIVASSAGTVQTDVGSVVSGWKPGAKDPVIAAREAELEGQVRKWSYTAGVDVSGKDGNSENFASSIQAEAKLEGPHDRFVIYGSYIYKETNKVRSEDEQKGGIRYTNFFTDKWGWFLREELERDTFEGIDFRSTTAAGLTYKFIQEERLSLEGSAGISYRYESYSDDDLDDDGFPDLDDDGFPGLDFGLNLGWQFADWGKLVTKLSYVPSVDDFGDYLVEHESGVDVPLGTSDAWVMRFGISHQYNSQPGGSREKLDTSYFARLILTWE
jgi:putative salt-induced outer membrane protein YdiY